jgi:hypothetical protein
VDEAAKPLPRPPPHRGLAWLRYRRYTIGPAAAGFASAPSWPHRGASPWPFPERGLAGGRHPVPAAAAQDPLGGGYYVWRSGIGLTKDGRIVYVYGSALNAQDLGLLLQRAGAVEGMQMDINPAWMKFDYYQAKGNPADTVPVPLLPTQQPSPYSYYTPSTRDFTAVYAR